MECIGAIDQGTQSSRFLLYNKLGNLICSSHVPVPQSYPRRGWVEQNAVEVLASVVEAMHTTLKEMQDRNQKVAIRAIGIANQRETTVVWDAKTGEPLYNAIVWMDGRTKGICDEVIANYGGRDGFRSVTGLPVSTYFSSYKLQWLIENVAEVAQAAAQGRCMFGTIDTWLIYNLTGGCQGGVHVTDVTNASRTNLMNIHTLSWSKDIMRIFKAENVILPKICSNAEVYGHVNMKSIPELAGIPISGSLGDQQAAMLGHRCQQGQAKNTYGTGCFMLLHTGTKPVDSSHGLLTTISHKLGPDAPVNYALEGSVAIAGQGISWLKDSLEIIKDPSETETLAASVSNSGGVYLVPAFGGLLAPWWEPDARGVIVGLTLGTTRAHIIRAMLEAICFQTADILEAMKNDADLGNLSCLFVDGGASKNELLMQMQADILQVRIERPANLETTSLGAALAAGLGVGLWTYQQVFEDLEDRSVTHTFVPNIEPAAAKVMHEQWKVAVQRAMGLATLMPGD
jgi:glycerol kinase